MSRTRTGLSHIFNAIFAALPNFDGSLIAYQELEPRSVSCVTFGPEPGTPAMGDVYVLPVEGTQASAPISASEQKGYTYLLNAVFQPIGDR